MLRPGKATRKNAGFTLVEVMVTMLLISILCLGVFAGMQQITKTAMAVAIRNEAYHLMQADAEQLLSGDYSSFVPTNADETITSAVKTSYMPSTAAQFAFTADNPLGRTTFTRRVVSVASSDTSRTLRVEVQWSWQGQTNLISTVLYRIQQ